RLPPTASQSSSTLFPYTTLFRSHISGMSSWKSIPKTGGSSSIRSKDCCPDEDFGPFHLPGNVQRRIQCLHPKAGTGKRRCQPHRSEEHTSELQSREKLVCRLLLE